MNSHRYQPKTAANVLRHLPLQRSLSASQTALVAITPAWQSWLTHAIKQKKLAPDTAQSIRLEAINPDRNSNSNQQHNSRAVSITGALVISCDSPVVATQLKYLRESIVEQLNAHQPSRNQSRVIISSVTVRVRPESGSLPIDQNATIAQRKEHSVKPSEASFRAIESAIENAAKHAQRSDSVLAADSDLASALRRLATTLRRLGQD